MEHLLNIIYYYYPQNMYPSDLKYSYTPEITRFYERQESMQKEHDIFKKLCADLEKSIGLSTLDYSFAGDCCRKAFSYIPKSYGITRFDQCVVSMSGMVNLYSIYLTKYYPDANHTTLEHTLIDEDKRKLIDDIVNIVKKYYPNFEPFPMEYYAKEVPLIFALQRYNELATYYECLMTAHILP